MSIPDGAIPVFDDDLSFVKLVESAGDELSIVNAARVSFHNESHWEERYEQFETDQTEAPQSYLVEKGLSEKDTGLIRFLLKNKHGSPFEQAYMAFHIRLPIFVMRELVRHRIGFSVNEESGRYVEMRPDFYIPKEFRTQKGKPGAYYFDKWKPDGYPEEFFKLQIQYNFTSAYELYEHMLDAGIAKEQARIVLPLNLYTEIRWTANPRSLMNFLTLRNSEHAMFEIKEYAKVLEKLFACKYPIVYNAFVNAGRIAP